jgi:uncharacterized LabA/DUF88 family protein
LGQLKSPLLFVPTEKKQRTALYVDGFNLYYGCLKDTPYKWFDFVCAARQVLDASNEITLVKYFTARVKPTADNPDVHKRQQIYLKALEATFPQLEIIEGRFLVLPGKKPSEKGSDVNLAIHLVNDAWLDRFDVGAVMSNDADLAGAIHMVKAQHKKHVGLIPPITNADRRLSNDLRVAASFVRSIRKSTLAECQLPNPVVRGTVELHKPPHWK